MKTLIFILFYLPISFFAQKSDYKILIDSALAIKVKEEYAFYQKEMKKDYSNSYLDSLNKSNYKTYIENIYLFYENNYPYFYDDKNSKIKFKQINIYDKTNRKILKKGDFGIKAWIVRPILIGNELTIFIPNYNIKYEKKRMNFSTSHDGSFAVTFRYFPSESKWKIIQGEN